MFIHHHDGKPVLTEYVGYPLIITRDQFEALVAEARAFYDQYSDGDIERINQETALKWQQQQEEDDRQDRTELEHKPHKKQPGYVYLLQSESGLYKIGLTKDPRKRAKTFGVLLPFSVEFICLIKTEDMPVLEAELHQRYASKRLNGEWFRLSPEDVDYIQRLASES